MLPTDGDVECDDLRLAVGVDLRRALAAFLASVADVVLDARPGHEQELLVGPDADGAGLRVGRLIQVKSASETKFYRSVLVLGSTSLQR